MDWMKRSLVAFSARSLRQRPLITSTSNSPNRASNSSRFQTWKQLMGGCRFANFAWKLYATWAKQTVNSSFDGIIADTPSFVGHRTAQQPRSTNRSWAWDPAGAMPVADRRDR